jgi:uncharacterized membrane protein HdeD (DUF308 family)
VNKMLAGGFVLSKIINCMNNKKQHETVSSIFAGVLFILLGLAGTFGASLQTIAFKNMLPNYVLIFIGVVILTFGEWQKYKGESDKINGIGLLSFALGFSGFMLATAKVGNMKSSILEIALMLCLCISSVITGVYAQKASREKGSFIGRASSITAIVLCSIVLFISGIIIVFEGLRLQIDLSRSL